VAAGGLAAGLEAGTKQFADETRAVAVHGDRFYTLRINIGWNPNLASHELFHLSSTRH
jgi:hypothetical protein